MEIPLLGFPGSAVIKDADKEIAAANNPKLRLLLVDKKSSDYPVNDEPDTWSPCTPATAAHFSAVEVLPEKHHAAYRSLARHHACEAETTWMIGNSPKSDINPAFAAGLHAIFIPHDFTWALEHEVIHQPPAGQQLLELASFADLAKHF